MRKIGLKLSKKSAELCPSNNPQNSMLNKTFNPGWEHELRLVLFIKVSQIGVFRI